MEKRDAIFGFPMIAQISYNYWANQISYKEMWPLNMATILIVNIQFYNAESIELQKYCLNIAPSSLYTK